MRSSKTEDGTDRRRSTKSKSGIVPQLNADRRIRQHFLLANGLTIEVDTIVTTPRELKQLPERNDPDWSQCPIGSEIVILQRVVA